MEINELVSKHSLGLPSPNVDVCQDNISRVMQINHIKNVEILRIDLDTPLISLRAKCLYNHGTEESFINLVDFSLKKIQLRGGGMGTKVISAVIDCHKKQLADQHSIVPNQTEMGIFKFLSIPFWIKQDFSFKQMTNIEDDEANHQNVVYKVFKLLIIMNETQDLHQYIDEFNLFSLEVPKIDDILKRQITAYHYKLYNQNLQIKSSLISHINSKCCDDFETDNMNYCTSITYKNICNQLTNEKLGEKIIPILQELFYLSKRV